MDQKKTVVFQSHHSLHQDWLIRCTQSVRHWCVLQGFDYQWLGDELFEINPAWFNEKVKGRGPILSDLARLKHSARFLENYERVIWLDADVFLFNPHSFSITQSSYLMGRECWVQPHKKGLKFGWKVYRSLCNAFLMFERDNPILPYYIHACEQTIKRVDPQWIAPQMIGPKFLTALNSVSPLHYTDQIGSASPHLIRDLAHITQFSSSQTPALDQMIDFFSQNTEQCHGLNLCASLVGTQAYDLSYIDEDVLHHAMDALEEKSNRLFSSLATHH